MVHVLFLHPLDYEVERKRFRSSAFQNSDDGISLVDLECANATSGGICAHARQFYVGNGVTSEPPLFILFEPQRFYPKSKIALQASTSGDDCHRNLKDVSRGEAHKFLLNKVEVEGAKQQINPESVLICEDGKYRPISHLELVGVKEFCISNGAK